MASSTGSVTGRFDAAPVLAAAGVGVGDDEVLVVAVLAVFAEFALPVGTGWQAVAATSARSAADAKGCRNLFITFKAPLTVCTLRGRKSVHATIRQSPVATTVPTAFFPQLPARPTGRPPLSRARRAP